MKAVQQTSRQHLVSQVVLKEFTLLNGSSGRQLLAFDLQYPERPPRLRPPSRCGLARDFVAFDSASAEQLWGRIEERVPAALAAVRKGTPFTVAAHAEVLRDLVVLHYVRSYKYRNVHLAAFERTRASVSARVAARLPQQLARAALLETGLHLTERGALMAYAEREVARSEMVRDHESGKLFRTSIEDTFSKVQKMASTWRVEILTPELGHQFLIGDNPGLTVRRNAHGGLDHGMAFGDATSMVLPVGPRCLVALGPDNLTGTLAASAVKALNRRQVLAAERHVYMHPHSALKSFVVTAAQGRPASPDM
ncbi:DUF4238 domain-containing protein [Streptomyces sp. NPDC059718]